MTRFFDAYKLFRNFTRRFDLETSMLDVWHYALFLAGDKPLPPHYVLSRAEHQFVPLTDLIYPWELDIIAKELILNAGIGGDRCLAKWTDLATAVNHVRRLDELTFELSDDKMRDVIFELHRIAHRQFPWQMKPTSNALTRAFKIYGSSQLNEIVKRELGCTAHEFIRLGIAIAGGFRNRPRLSVTQDYTCLGISPETSKLLLTRLSRDIRSLREETKAHQRYDRDWVYSWNPLELTPLIALDAPDPGVLICPIPSLALRRVTSGLYYDIVNAAGFDNPFGNAFQTYIGEVLRAACSEPPFTIWSETPYYIGSQLHHGTDWIVSDDDAHLFIECKTKRLRLDAKTRSDMKALQSDVAVLAMAIVQNYRNIKHALDGNTAWSTDGRPIYPLILTLEDWFIFSPQVDELLNSEVKRLLNDNKLDPAILEEMPFIIASAHEFEIAIQIVATVGIAEVMAAKSAGEHRTWGLDAFLRNKFSDQMRSVNLALFAADAEKLMSMILTDTE